MNIDWFLIKDIVLFLSDRISATIDDILIFCHRAETTEYVQLLEEAKLIRQCKDTRYRLTWVGHNVAAVFNASSIEMVNNEGEKTTRFEKIVNSKSIKYMDFNCLMRNLAFHRSDKYILDQTNFVFDSRWIKEEKDEEERRKREGLFCD